MGARGAFPPDGSVELPPKLSIPERAGHTVHLKSDNVFAFKLASTTYTKPVKGCLAWSWQKVWQSFVGTAVLSTQLHHFEMRSNEKEVTSFDLRKAFRLQEKNCAHIVTGKAGNAKRRRGKAMHSPCQLHSAWKRQSQSCRDQYLLTNSERSIPIAFVRL